MTGWSLVYDSFAPDEEGRREALCTLGNGYFATRGAAPEAQGDVVHYPGTYVAGCYNRLQTAIAGRVVENEDLVNLPNWLALTFRIDGGDWFHLSAVEIDTYRQELDLRRGLLLRTIRFRDREGRETRVTSRRLVHMGRPHLAALETTITAENWSGHLEVRSALDGRVVNAGVARYHDLANRHLDPVESRIVGDETLFLKVRTNQSEVRISEAARTRLFVDGKPAAAGRRNLVEPGFVAQDMGLDLAAGSRVTVEKVVALYTSRDHAIAEGGLAACTAVDRAGGFEALLESHMEAWDHLWRRFEIMVGDEGDHALRTLRVHVFHLLQTTSLNTLDLDVGVPARGLHGEAYRGHIFWDELFIFPFLNLRMPEITRALLQYRYRRLDEARAAAAAAGFRGAMYPWQSGSDGREESQRLHYNPVSGRWIPDNSHLQRHVSSAVAYNVWQYYQATRDIEFLTFYGAEMMFEIARFWASIAAYNEALGRYEILGVMGPDEYHDAYHGADAPGLDNSAYTNMMAVWVLCRALELLEILPPDRMDELSEALGLHPDEIARWDDISRKMRIVFHDGAIISQFEGYDRLNEFDWDGYRDKYGNIQRLDRILEAEGDSPNRYKLSKQADVLMLFYLFSAEELDALFERLGYRFEPETIPRNIAYYTRRTCHGSTLSRVVHSWVLARSDRPRAWRLFTEALQADVDGAEASTTAEGIHLGAMAGTVDLVQRAFTGIETRGDVLWLNPCLPEALERLHLRVRYRGHSLSVEVTPKTLKVAALRTAAQSVKIGIKGRVYELLAGETKEFPLA